MKMTKEDSNQILKEILKWQKIQGIEILKRRVKENNLFSDNKHILAYHHSDGNKSSRDVGKVASISHGTVQNLWKAWIDSGIAEPSEKYKGGQCRRLFELSDLGLELPKTKKQDNKND